MSSLHRITGFIPYLLMIFLNAFVDLGHKIIVQNSVFKLYEGETQIILTAVVNGLILLPFLLLFSPAGFLADKYPKHRVMQASAWFAVLITGLITLSYYLGWFWVAFGLTLLLAAQSAIYSPAKYGYIRELVGTESLASANGSVQAVTIIAILSGTFVFSGLFEVLLANVEWQTGSDILTNIAPLGWALVALTSVELLIAYQLPALSKTNQHAHFTPKAYLKGQYLRSNVSAIHKHRIIFLSIIGLGIFWALSQSVLAIFPAFAKATLQETNTVVIQGLLACSGIGIVLGSLLAARVSRHHIESGLIPLGAVLISIMLVMLPLTTSVTSMALTFICLGLGGGILIVPLNSLIQYHAGEHQSGTILAGSNWVQNLMMISFLVLTVFTAKLGLDSQAMFACLALLSLAATVFAVRKLPHSLARILVSILFRRRYRLHVLGFENLPRQGAVLLLGNHISWIDWALVQIASPRPVRFVMLRSIYEKPLLKPIFQLFKVIPISSGSSQQALEAINISLKQGEVVCLFPEGAISRNGQLGEFKRGYEKTIDDVDGVIVPFYLHGLWGSRFSRAESGLQATTNGIKRDLFICFGQPLAITTTAIELKQKVFELSISAWTEYTNHLPVIPLAFLQKAKQQLLRPICVDSSSGETLRYYNLIHRVLLMASLVKRKAPKQQNIGLLLPATSMTIAANLGVMLTGRKSVNLNFTASEQAFMASLDKAQIQTVITSSRFLKKLQGKGIEVDRMLVNCQVIVLEELLQQLSRWQLMSSWVAAICLPAHLLNWLYGHTQTIDEPATILFSSGSEGIPKGILLSHRNIMSNIKQISAMLDTRQDDIIMGGLPAFHAFGLTVTHLLPVVEGIPIICHPDPTDVLSAAKAIATHKATVLCGTATFLRLYSRNRRVEPLMLDSLRLVIAGAEKLQAEVRETFEKKFNKRIYEGYGATETTPVASVNIEDRLDPGSWKIQRGNKPGTVGLPVPGCGFRIVDPETFAPLPAEEAGLVLIAGNQVMLGYLDEPEKTAKAIIELDGQRWYNTGDKGQLDSDGFLRILDRYSRFVKIGGEMISLQAVEQALLQNLHPLDETLELMAIGLPDEKKGEKIAILVVTKLDESTFQQALMQSDMDNLMRPGLVMITDSLPVLGSGKPDFQTAKRLLSQSVPAENTESTD